MVAGYLGASLLRLGHHDVYDDSHDPIKVPFSGNYPSRKLQPHYPDYIPYAAYHRASYEMSTRDIRRL